MYPRVARLQLEEPSPIPQRLRRLLRNRAGQLSSSPPTSPRFPSHPTRRAILSATLDAAPCSATRCTSFGSGLRYSDPIKVGVYQTTLSTQVLSTLLTLAIREAILASQS